MFNNGFNNNFNSVSKNLQTGNIAGINKNPSSVVGVTKAPINKMPVKNNPFSNVKIDRQMSKSIMNSSGENVIRNDFNKNGGNNGNC